MSSSAAAAPAALRSGSGTWVSVSLMVQSSCSGLVAGRHVAPDEVVGLCFDSAALEDAAAVGPFDPAVAGRDFRLGQDHEPALEAALRGLPLDLLARRVIESVVDPHHQMRGCDQMREAVADEARDFAKRLGGHQLAA